jgi:AraC-like DNA-binding protein
MAKLDRPHIRDGFPGQRMLVLPRPVVRAVVDGSAGADVFPTDVGYFPDAAWHDVSRPEGSPQLIVIYCVRGQGWARVGSRELLVRAGDVLTIPAGLPHAYGAGGTHPWTLYWLHAVGRRTDRLGALLTEEGKYPSFPSEGDADTLGLFEEIYETLLQSYRPDDLLLASLAAGRLLSRLVTLRRRSRRHVSSTRERIDRTIAFMRQRLESHVSVPELARLANLSNSHYAAAFKRHTGYSVLDYFIHLKMQRAAHLLDTTTLPAKEIASALGYEDPLYFSRQFRSVYDLAPTQYRAIKKG